MPEFAFKLFTVVETDKFKDNQECTSRLGGRRVQSSRKRLENDDTAEEAAIYMRKRVSVKAAMARALKRKGPGWPDLDSEG